MSQQINFPFPAVSEHTTIMGRNGSGKTQGGVWLASHAPFDIQPLIFVDSKGDELINRLGAVHLSLDSAPPHDPGLYIIKPRPRIDDDVLNAFLWKVHAKERTCLFFDEGYVVSDLDALDTILMQGRSKHIQVTLLCQRPSWISRFAFSEASHYIAYDMHDQRDQKVVKQFFRNYDPVGLPEFHAQWYDVKKNKNYILKPVPTADIIIDRYKSRVAEIEARKRENRKTVFNRFF